MSTMDICIPEDMSEVERQSILEFVEKLRAYLDRQLLAVVVFGSRARHQAEPTSDMDLMVVLTKVDADIRETVRYLAAEVWLENGIFLSTRVWNLAYWHKLKALQTGLYQNICHDGITLYSLLDEPVLA